MMLVASALFLVMTATAVQATEGATVHDGFVQLVSQSFVAIQFDINASLCGSKAAAAGNTTAIVEFNADYFLNSTIVLSGDEGGSSPVSDTPFNLRVVSSSAVTTTALCPLLLVRGTLVAKSSVSVSNCTMTFLSVSNSTFVHFFNPSASALTAYSCDTAQSN